MRNYQKFYEKTINNFDPPKGFKKKYIRLYQNTLKRPFLVKAFKKLLTALILVKGF